MSGRTFLQKKLAELAEQYNLVAIYAFGSRAEEIAARVADAPMLAPISQQSDVDIGVLPEWGHHLDARDRVRIMIALEDLFNVTRVDLIIVPEAPAFLALDVVSGELLYTSDSDAEAEFQLYVLRRAGDLAPFERERRRLIVEGKAF